VRRVVLFAVKTIHTSVFVVVAAAGLLVFADGVRGRPSRRTGIAAAIAVAESAVFVGNGFTCPLTPLAERYGARKGSVSDIFLPDVIATNLPVIGGTILLVGLALNGRALLADQAGPMSSSSESMT
jgi:hypothetical protein